MKETVCLNQSQLWEKIVGEAQHFVERSPELATWFEKVIFQHQVFSDALAYQLAMQLCDDVISCDQLQQYFIRSHQQHPAMVNAALKDLLACYARDPACEAYLMPLLYFKGYQSLQAQRLAHIAWKSEHMVLAYFIQSQMSCRLGVDMHPAVQLGSGIMLDHATGVVMGETTVVGDNVSILHGVTLGGCGTGDGIRHPQIGDGALISAGAQILGAVTIGAGAKIAAGSLVLEDVAAHCTVAGVPARVVGAPKSQSPAEDMDQTLE